MGDRTRAPKGFAQVSDAIGEHISSADLIRILAGEDRSVALTSFSGFDLADLDARDALFDRVVFRSCTFENVDFSGSAFTNVRFAGCRFTGCSFERCRMTRVDIRDTSFPGARLAKAWLDHVTIDGCQLRYADLSQARLHTLRAHATTLAESTWYDTKLGDIAFDGCDLSGAEFVRTPLARIDLSRAQIAGLTVSDNLRELRGAIIAPEQAAELIGLLGVRIAEQ